MTTPQQGAQQPHPYGVQDNGYVPQGGNPYGTPAGNSYGNPHGPQGGNPYGAQGGNPYGAQGGNPYGTPGGNAYGNPYGNQAAPPYGAPAAPAGGATAPPYGAPAPAAPGQGNPWTGANPYSAQQSGHAMAAAQSFGCRVCGAPEARPITLRAHQGLLLAMRFSSVKGPLCRDCGIALNRDMSTKTLSQGWWSPVSAVFFAWVTLVWCLVAHFRLKSFPQPSAPLTGPRPQLGAPVHQRPAAYVGLLPIGWVLFCIVSTLFS